MSNLAKGDRVVVPFPIARGTCFFCTHELLVVMPPKDAPLGDDVFHAMKDEPVREPPNGPARTRAFAS